MESAWYIGSAQVCGFIHFFVSVGGGDNRINSETMSQVKT